MCALPYATTSGLPFGSRILSIGGTNYIANNFRVEQAGKLLERTTELGAPNGAVLIDTAYTGSAELQLAANTTAYPNISMTFNTRNDQENANMNFFLTQVGAPEAADQWKFVDVQFREVA